MFNRSKGVLRTTRAVQPTVGEQRPAEPLDMHSAQRGSCLIFDWREFAASADYSSKVRPPAMYQLLMQVSGRRRLSWPRLSSHVLHRETDCSVSRVVISRSTMDW